MIVLISACLMRYRALHCGKADNNGCTATATSVWALLYKAARLLFDAVSGY